MGYVQNPDGNGWTIPCDEPGCPSNYGATNDEAAQLLDQKTVPQTMLYQGWSGGLMTRDIVGIDGYVAGTFVLACPQQRSKEWLSKVTGTLN